MKNNDPQDIKTVIDNLYRQNPSIGTRMTQERISMWWASHYPQYVKYTSTIKFDGSHLSISLKSAALRHTLSLSRNEIINEINAYIGKEAVRFLYFL